MEKERGPLGSPAHADTSNQSHKFMFKQDDGGPVAYDPCRPIHYVTRQDNAPPGGQDLINRAVADVSKATGLVFIDDGATTEGHSSVRSAYQPDRYGKRWAPVLIVWATPQEQARFVHDDTPGATNTAGLGGSQPIQGDKGSKVLVTGTIQLNAPYLAKVLERHDGMERVSSTIRHELGHLVGLDHVDDKAQLMYGLPGRNGTTFGGGDLSGLAALGQGQCFPNQ